VWDVDGDGVDEVLFTTNVYGTRLWCFDGFGLFEWVYPRIEMDDFPSAVKSKVSLVDLEDDGVMELAVLDVQGRLYVLRGNGSLVWYWGGVERGPGEILGPPQGMDVDGDGLVEFFTLDCSGHLYRISDGGELVWTSSVAAGSGSSASPTICDLDQDGEFELVWTKIGGPVFCLDARTGSQEWVFPTEAYPNILVADVNDDREYEVLVWTRLHLLVCLSFYGSEIWRYPYPEDLFPVIQCAALGDVDRDGGLDLVYLLRETGVCLDVSASSASLKWEVNLSSLPGTGTGGLPGGSMGGGSVSYQSLADFDCDGEEEVLWLVPFPVVVDGATGDLEAFYLDDYVRLEGVDVEDGGWWGDVDNDSRSEWLCDVPVLERFNTTIYCLTMGGVFPAVSSWPEYYHTAYPAEYQQGLDWLTLKSAGSNSLWFPIPEAGMLLSVLLLLVSIVDMGVGCWHDWVQGGGRGQSDRRARCWVEGMFLRTVGVNVQDEKEEGRGLG
jgi:outer membrane protein assembly factor BamB